MNVNELSNHIEQENDMKYTIEGIKIKIELLERKLGDKQSELTNYAAAGLANVVSAIQLPFLNFIISFCAIVLMVIFSYLSIFKDNFNIFLLSASLILYFIGKRMEKKSKNNIEDLNSKNIINDDKENEIKIEISELISEIHKYEDILDELVTNAHLPHNNNYTDTVECPQCAETIKSRAKICRFCYYKFEEATN